METEKITLDIDSNVLNHAEEVADAINDKYHRKGGNIHTLYVDRNDILEYILSKQVEYEQQLDWKDPDYSDRTVFNEVMLEPYFSK